MDCYASKSNSKAHQITVGAELRGLHDGGRKGLMPFVTLVDDAGVNAYHIMVMLVDTRANARGILGG